VKRQGRLISASKNALRQHFGATPVPASTTPANPTPSSSPAIDPPEPPSSAVEQ
jgi:hypothetical protein